MTTPHHIEIIEPVDEHAPPPPEGNVKYRNYRLLADNLRAYTPTGDVHTSPTKGKLVARFDSCCTISPNRSRILELVRADDPGRDALEAIVRPAARRPSQTFRPLDDDSRRYLQRTLLSPSPQGLSAGNTPEPPHSPVPNESEMRPKSELEDRLSPVQNRPQIIYGRSLADELREAEDCRVYPDILYQDNSSCGSSEERDRLGRLALSVEVDEGPLASAARRLDALLAESRTLHGELHAIHQDMQAECRRAVRCEAAARALDQESQALRYLDDVVALLRGDVARATRARQWPFALGQRKDGRNYII